MINENSYNYGHSNLFFREKIRDMFCESNYVINEAMFDIYEDVDYIWENGFKVVIEYYKNNPKEIYNICSIKKDKIVVILKSINLPSSISKEASLDNPIDIYIGFINVGNSYDVRNRRINLTLNCSAIEALGLNGLEYIHKVEKTYPTIASEFSKLSLRGTISHELAHWLDESYHDKNITRILKQVTKDKNKKNFSKTYFSLATIQEIDANIHAINSMKHELGQEEWDKLTFMDILSKKPSLKHAFDKLKTLDKKRYFEWKKRFFGRMAREGLIGKNVR